LRREAAAFRGFLASRIPAESCSCKEDCGAGTAPADRLNAGGYELADEELARDPQFPDVAG
jgi:hypothetical protein